MSDDVMVNTAKEMASLEPGQWAVDADGDVVCLFETHMGAPQRMWGAKADGGTRGRATRFVSMDGASLPLHLADIVEGTVCGHREANECGQCLYCGAPEVGPRNELHFGEEGLRLIRMAADHNARVERERAEAKQ